MSGAHWSDCYVAWLRGFAPELGGEPFYFRSQGEIDPQWHEKNAVAWTHANLDLKLRPGLIEHGQWQGRGVTVVFNPRYFELPHNLKNGYVLHEMAHVIADWFDPWRRPEEEFSSAERQFLEPGGRERLIAEWAPEIAKLPGGIETLALAAAGGVDEKLTHGAAFVRAGLHLWSRSGRVADIHDLVLCRWGYVRSDVLPCLEALGDELQRTDSLLDIIREPMPAAFLELFKQSE